MKRLLCLCLALGLPGLAPAQQQAVPPAAEEATPLTVEQELTPQPGLGPRTLADVSPEAAAIRRKQLLENSNRPLPPVPSSNKARIFDQISATVPMSMREMFNYMTYKRKVAKGIKFDDVIESMEIKANEVNFKKVGHSKLWRDVGAITGLPTLRVEILLFCDAIVGRKILNYSPEFSIFIPCRITVMEDATGDIWLMTMDWDVTWLAKAWHPDSQLSEELKADAMRIRDAMNQIMEAGANGQW
ncbi:MAG: DUF302 domain-containing protein [Gammaproteobacteria bacterium]|nr:DUF302 domain-containing protein [Gammaproteobacteria bacterium]